MGEVVVAAYYIKLLRADPDEDSVLEKKFSQKVNIKMGSMAILGLRWRKRSDLLITSI